MYVIAGIKLGLNPFYVKCKHRLICGNNYVIFPKVTTSSCDIMNQLWSHNCSGRQAFVV